MGCCKTLVLLLLVSFLMALGAEGHVWDQVERLPGQPKVPFRQFAGYVDVDDDAGRSLFYYLAEALRGADRKPLTLWLNGGPGCSSVGGGAFTELGPFFPTGDGRGLRINKHSWIKVSNILFVDSPAGVGWSYSNTTSDYTNVGDERTAVDMRRFLLGWFDKFPRYKSHDLFLAGESYAGHYIPQLANLLLDYNKKSTSGFKFNLKGLAIGNPLLRVSSNAQAMYDYLWSHGMISEETWLAITSQCSFKDYEFKGSDHNLSPACNAAIAKADSMLTSYVDPYDVILDVCFPQIAEQELQLREIVTKKSLGVDVCMSSERRFYFNTPQVQEALHANRTGLPYPWKMCNGRLHGFLRYNRSDHDTDMLPALRRIIEHQIPVWIYSGDQDSTVPLLGSRALVKELAAELKFAVTVPYGSWFHRDQIGGWATEYGNMLTFATVRGASHLVPYSQPARALALFRCFVGGRQLPNATYPAIYDFNRH